MRSGASLYLFSGLYGVLLSSIRAVGGHGVKGIGDSYDASHERYLFTCQARRVTGAVEFFLVVLHGVYDDAKLPYGAQYGRAYRGVLHGYRSFFFGKLPLFVQDVVPYAYLADVVEERGYLELFFELFEVHYIFVACKLIGYGQGIVRHPLSMAGRVRVAGVYGRGERYRGVYKEASFFYEVLFSLFYLLLEVLYKLGVSYGHGRVVGERYEETQLVLVEFPVGRLCAEYKYAQELLFEVSRYADIGAEELHFFSYFVYFVFEIFVSFK